MAGMEYCTIQEAAELLAVSRPTVYKMIESGDLERATMLGRPALKKSAVLRLKAKRDKKENGSNGKR